MNTPRALLSEMGGRIALLVIPLVFVVALLVAGCSQQPDAPAGPTGPAAKLEGADLAKAGQALFATQPCTRCHEFQGKGGKMGPKLDHVGDHDYAWHFAHLNDPKSKTPKSRMPSFSQLPLEQRELLAKWLASLK